MPSCFGYRLFLVPPERGRSAKSLLNEQSRATKSELQSVQDTDKRVAAYAFHRIGLAGHTLRLDDVGFMGFSVIANVRRTYHCIPVGADHCWASPSLIACWAFLPVSPGIRYRCDVYSLHVDHADGPLVVEFVSGGQAASRPSDSGRAIVDAMGYNGPRVSHCSILINLAACGELNIRFNRNRRSCGY